MSTWTVNAARSTGSVPARNGIVMLSLPYRSGGYRVLSALAAIAECDHAGAAARASAQGPENQSHSLPLPRGNDLHRDLVNAPSCEPGHDR